MSSFAVLRFIQLIYYGPVILGIILFLPFETHLSFELGQSYWWREWGLAIKNTLIILVTASAVSAILGSLLSPSFFHPKRQKWAGILWFPFWLPQLFHVQAFYFWFSSWIRQGALAVGLMQGLSLSGLMAYFLVQQKKNLQHQEFLFQLFEVPKTRAHLFKLYAPAWKKAFMQSLYLHFMMDVTGLSLPLAIGGPSGQNLEGFLFYHLPRYGLGHWAVLLTLLVQLGLFFLAYKENKTINLTPLESSEPIRKSYSTVWLERFSLFLFVCYLIFYGQTLIKPLISLIDTYLDEDTRVQLLSESVLFATSASFHIALAVSLMFWGSLFSLTQMIFRHPKTKTTFLRLLPLSSSLCYLGYQGFIHFLGKEVGLVLALSLGYQTLYLPSLLRLNLLDEIEKNRISYRFAKLLEGHSKYRLSRFFVLRVFSPVFARLSLVASIWILFDYSWIQFFIDTKIMSIAMTTQSLFSSYHKKMAEALLGVMIVMTGILILYYRFMVYFNRFVFKLRSRL